MNAIHKLTFFSNSRQSRCSCRFPQLTFLVSPVFVSDTKANLDQHSIPVSSYSNAGSTRSWMHFHQARQGDDVLFSGQTWHIMQVDNLVFEVPMRKGRTKVLHDFYRLSRLRTRTGDIQSQ